MVVGDAVVVLLVVFGIALLVVIVTHWLREESAAHNQRAPFLRSDQDAQRRVRHLTHASTFLRSERRRVGPTVNGSSGFTGTIGGVEVRRVFSCPHCQAKYGITDIYCQECGRLLPGRTEQPSDDR